MGPSGGRFAQAYFQGDREAVRGFLADSFQGNIDLYEGDPNAVETRPVRGAESASEAAEGDVVWLSLPFVEASEDSYVYLSMELILQADGWKVRFYGLEK